MGAGGRSAASRTAATYRSWIGAHPGRTSTRSVSPPSSIRASASRWKCHPAATEVRCSGGIRLVHCRTSSVASPSARSSKRSLPWGSPSISRSPGGSIAVIVASITTLSPSSSFNHVIVYGSPAARRGASTRPHQPMSSAGSVSAAQTRSTGCARRRS